MQSIGLRGDVEVTKSDYLTQNKKKWSAQLNKPSMWKTIYARMLIIYARPTIL